MNKSMINRVLKPLALTMAVTMGVCITEPTLKRGIF